MSTTATGGLQSAFDMFEFAVAVREQTLRRQHPEATDTEIASLLQAWLLERPGAPLGDYSTT